MIKHRKIEILIIVLLIGLVSACGKKGDLFLPEEKSRVSTVPEQQPEKDKTDKKKTPAIEN